MTFTTDRTDHHVAGYSHSRVYPDPKMMHTLQKARAKRTHQDNDHNTRRQLNANYLAALARTRNNLRLAACSARTSPEERARKAIEAFKEDNAYELRYQIALMAPAPVIEASTTAFRTLRDLRDLIESYIDLSDRWGRALR
ncbi:hypothetical protein [Streptomyces sp. NPDC048196]|uniref:hypothetical protein n=1 Tax=Streptomyces sp. NPDC048196 TaxID=3154712 RepID=UPI003410E333